MRGGRLSTKRLPCRNPARLFQAVATKPLPHLPPGSLEHFTRKIQPLLRNGCASCHRGDEADPLGLDPQWVRGHASARSTQQNLRAVLEQIDLASPEASYLLSAARGPHHGATPFRGPRRNELIDRLEAWVLELAAANPPSAGSSAAHGTASPPADSAVTQASHDTPAASAPAAEPEPFQVPENSIRDTSPERGDTQTGWPAWTSSIPRSSTSSFAARKMTARRAISLPCGRSKRILHATASALNAAALAR